MCVCVKCYICGTRMICLRQTRRETTRLWCGERACICVCVRVMALACVCVFIQEATIDCSVAVINTQPLLLSHTNIAYSQHIHVYSYIAQSVSLIHSAHADDDG